MSTAMLEPQIDDTTTGTIRLGEIFRISPIALCYFADPTTDEVFCCTCDKFKGYRGQYPTEFGMIPGTAVNFELDEAGDVAWVDFL